MTEPRRFTDIDLGTMAPPDVIETLDFERIVEALRDDLVARLPSIANVIDLKSEPSRKLIEAFAYREMLLRARINDAARSVLISSAGGADLDHLGAFYGTVRQMVPGPDGEDVPEDDARFRRRVQLAPEAFSTAGPAGAYIYHALTAAPWARDASATSPAPGKVRVAVLQSGDDPEPDPADLADVRAALRARDIRPLTDDVHVTGPDVVDVDIEATLSIYSGPDHAMVRARAEAALGAWLEHNRMLGRSLRRSAIMARLHVEGVHNVDLVAPGGDIEIEPWQVYRIASTQIAKAPTEEI